MRNWVATQGWREVVIINPKGSETDLSRGKVGNTTELPFSAKVTSIEPSENSTTLVKLVLVMPFEHLH